MYLGRAYATCYAGHVRCSRACSSSCLAGAAFGTDRSSPRSTTCSRTLSDITGWKVQRTVPAEILSKDNFRKMVEEGVKDAETNKETRAAEIALKMFGLVPQDFNLARESGDLLAEQAAAFYDYKKKRLFVLDSTKTDNEQLIALAHELAHALADQQHPLRKFISDADGDEQSTARQSVIEGQATWLSWAYLSKKSGGRGEVPRALVDRLAEGAGASGDDFPVFSQAPLYIRESLTFPYTEGMRFQDAVYRELGPAAFERVFRDPPRSTQHIMHPETYLAGRMPTMPALPRLEEPAGKEARHFRILADGDVGEFDYWRPAAPIHRRNRGPRGRGALARAEFIACMSIRRRSIRCWPTPPSGTRRRPRGPSSSCISGCCGRNGRSSKSLLLPRRR